MARILASIFSILLALPASGYEMLGVDNTEEVTTVATARQQYPALEQMPPHWVSPEFETVPAYGESIEVTSPPIMEGLRKGFAAVPEPGTTTLLVLGLFALLLRRRFGKH